MPLYEYKCDCGKTFDALQGMTEPKLELCQNNCDNPKEVTRLLGTPLIISDDPGRMPDKKLYKELDIE